MSTHLLQHALIEARGDRTRSQIADRAAAVRGGDPDFDEKTVERHECRMRTPPANGLALRTHCAAVGLELPEAYTRLGYWPPLDLGPEQIPLAILTDTCRRLGIQLTHHDPSTGRVVIQL